MSILKSVWSLRKSSHVHTRLHLRDEKAYHYRLVPWLMIVFVAFSFVDWFSSENSRPEYFFALRLGGVVLSYSIFRWLRGRSRYGFRIFCVLVPYVYPVQYVMITEGLISSPYFSGVSLVLITSTMLFPMNTRIAALVYTGSVLPIFAWLVFNPLPDRVDMLNALLMTVGSVLVCAVNSGQVYKDLIRQLTVAELLARDLGRRGKEIRRKAEELLRRRTFESQFSPQVVSAVLSDSRALREMGQRNIAVVVVDIENSTGKAKALAPGAYKDVVEEVFDVFSSACLKWNVTVDKFTGDGAQAFSGAPVSAGNDLERAVMACNDTIRMIRARVVDLEHSWGGTLNIRFAVVQGQALVGFLGRGAMKSFTAIGDNVSLAHRLCGVTDPWTIALYSANPKQSLELPELGVRRSEKVVGDLKGFGDKSFDITLLSPHQGMLDVGDYGRCSDCYTPMVIDDGIGGLPKIVCPGCIARMPQAA